MDKRYQVFVSSTYADLKDERERVIQALMEMDCIPAGMELFPAADEEQFHFIKSIINDCDYYVLIVGGRYGSTAEDGISYTEKEYEYAKSLGLSVLSFIHENPSELSFAKSEPEPTRRELLEKFRNKIKLNTLVKFWNTPAELPGLVSLSLAKTIKAHPAVGWVRANQLANSEVLNELNDVRKKNDLLAERNRHLEKQIASAHPKLTDLAGLEEAYRISGDRQYPQYSGKRGWSFSISWGSLFAAIGPYVLARPNDAAMELSFTRTVRELYEQHCHDHDEFKNWSLDGSHYQTVKVQLMALNLIDVSMKETASGGLALFWSLTPSGEATLLRLRTIKRKPAES